MSKGNGILVAVCFCLVAASAASSSEDQGWGHESAAGVVAHSVGSVESHHGKGWEGWGWTAPKYKYSYGVKDLSSKDEHEASEWRDGDSVKGHYSLREPDGSWRTVTYVSDKGGFRAHVQRTNGGGWAPEKH